jgi:hypothetical protein
MRNKNRQLKSRCTAPPRAALLSFLSLLSLLVASQPASWAGFGNMFGNNNSNSSDPSAATNANPGGDYMLPGTPGAGLSDPNPPKSLFGNGKKKNNDDPKLPQNGDFTEDEKRVQKKWQDRIAGDHRLIDRGEKMMRGAKNNPKDKDYQKGKVMKSIGEKDLAEMKSNSPFPSSTIEADGKKTKPDSL